MTKRRKSPWIPCSSPLAKTQGAWYSETCVCNRSREEVAEIGTVGGDQLGTCRERIRSLTNANRGNPLSWPKTPSVRQLT